MARASGDLVAVDDEVLCVAPAARRRLVLPDIRAPWKYWRSVSTGGGAHVARSFVRSRPGGNRGESPLPTDWPSLISAIIAG